MKLRLSVLLLFFLAILPLSTVIAQEEESLTYPVSLHDDGSTVWVLTESRIPDEEDSIYVHTQYTIYQNGQQVWQGGVDEFVVDFDGADGYAIVINYETKSVEARYFVGETVMLMQDLDADNVRPTGWLDKTSDVLFYAFTTIADGEWETHYYFTSVDGSETREFPNILVEDVNHFSGGLIEMEEDGNLIVLYDYNQDETLFRGTPRDYVQLEYDPFTIRFSDEGTAGFTTEVSGCQLDIEGDCIKGTEYSYTDNSLRYRTATLREYEVINGGMYVGYGSSSVYFGYTDFMFVQVDSEGFMTNLSPIVDFATSHSFEPSFLGIPTFENIDGYSLLNDGTLIIIADQQLWSIDIFIYADWESQVPENVTAQYIG